MPFYDCLSGVAAMAVATSTLRFVSWVYILSMRNAALAARQIATVSDLTGGRLTLGVGVGWLREEFDVLGFGFTDRGRRTDEMLDFLAEIWRTGSAEYRGPSLQVPLVRVLPPPRYVPPVWSGGHSDAALRRAARHDGWIGLILSRQETKHHLERLASARRREGRENSASFARLMSPAEPPTRELFDDLESLGVTGVVVFPGTMSVPPDAPRRHRLEEISGFGERFIHDGRAAK
jgi:alkanesulfonate monooxygenase SsuD/methylene tetrahydromethanopterin reductase-like flavin-dependent oxidoreductase (luciferase family)